MTEKPNSLSRRDFLKIMGFGFGGLAISSLLGGSDPKSLWDPVFKVDFDLNHEALSYNEAKKLALRFDRIYDQIPAKTVEVNEKSLEQWTDEILGMFPYNGLVSVNTPDVLEFIKYYTGENHNHIGGQSNCESYVKINYRFSNSKSTWFEDPMFLTVLVHELSHLQQRNMCSNRKYRENIETAAQIMTVEIMASMVNGGNKEMFLPLVSEMRSLSLNACYYNALTHKETEDFTAFREKLSPGAFSQARFQRAKRHWDENPGELLNILKEYSYKPLNLIVKAVKFDSSIVKGLPIPVTHFGYSSGSYRYLANDDNAFKLDDTKYFLENVERMVKEL